MRVSKIGSSSSWGTWWPTSSYPHHSDAHCAAHVVAQGGTLLVVGHDTTNLADGVGRQQEPRC